MDLKKELLRSPNPSLNGPVQHPDPAEPLTLQYRMKQDSQLQVSKEPASDVHKQLCIHIL